MLQHQLNLSLVSFSSECSAKMRRDAFLRTRSSKRENHTFCSFCIFDFLPKELCTCSSHETVFWGGCEHKKEKKWAFTKPGVWGGVGFWCFFIFKLQLTFLIWSPTQLGLNFESEILFVETICENMNKVCLYFFYKLKYSISIFWDIYLFAPAFYVNMSCFHGKITMSV